MSVSIFALRVLVRDSSRVETMSDARSTAGISVLICMASRCVWCVVVLKMDGDAILLLVGEWWRWLQSVFVPAVAIVVHLA